MANKAAHALRGLVRSRQRHLRGLLPFGGVRGGWRGVLDRPRLRRESPTGPPVLGASAPRPE